METRQCVLVLCVAVVSLVHAGRHDAYSSYTVHGVYPRNSSDMELLQRLEVQLDLDVWQFGAPQEREALLMVAPQHRPALLSTLDHQGIQHYVHTENVAKAIERNEEEIATWKRTRKNRSVFQDYLRYAEIDAYMERIAAQYPDLVTLVNVGRSFEGRDIKYLKISTTNFADPSKPIYFMNAMIHAREWVTTPVALYSVYRLVENLRSEDGDLRSDVDWIVLPLVNPDGYEFSHTGTRLWRKTRSLNIAVHATCFGVDGNRNFDANFNTLGVSSNPCQDTYPGTHPFSEPETGYVRDILMEYNDRIQIYMDIHSHGNWVLFGYGDRSLPQNAAQLFHLGSAMGAVMDAQKLPQAGFYRVGNSATILYVSSGSAQDYGQLVGVPFSYTLELPGYGYGFLVPPQYVDQINEETWQGIAVSARIARSFYRVRYNAVTTVAPTAATTADPTAATTANPTAATTADPTTATTADPTTATTADPTATTTADPTTATTAAPTATTTADPTATTTADPTASTTVDPTATTADSTAATPATIANPTAVPSLH